MHPSPEKLQDIPIINNNPDSRNATLDYEYVVRVYFQTGREHEFPARDLSNARDIAARCVREYVWIILPNGEEEHFPPTEIHKTKIVKVKE